MAAPPTPPATGGPAPIYHKESRGKAVGIRLYLIAVIITILSAMIYSLVVAIKDGIPILFLSSFNMLLSGITGLVVVWWYKKEQLNEDKLWYLLLLGLLIIFQCVTADIFVGHAQQKVLSPTDGPPAEIAPIRLLAPTIATTKKP